MQLVKTKCSKFGGSSDTFRKIIKLEFLPFDEL